MLGVGKEMFKQGMELQAQRYRHCDQYRGDKIRREKCVQYKKIEIKLL